MIDFSKINTPVDLTANWILSKISQSAIFAYYFQPFKFNKAYNSKLRRDRNPSVYLRLSSKGNIILTDASTGEYWNCFSYVSKLYNCNFNGALRQIASDFGILDKTISRVPKHIIDASEQIEKKSKESCLIQFIPDKWNKRHLDFWRQGEITQDDLLEDGNVFQVKKLFINKKEVFNYDNELRFAYTQKYDDKVGVKIYSPYSTKMKWISSLPLSVMFDLDKLKFKSDIVFIQKSKKDELIFKKIFSDVCSTQNESESAFTLENQEYLKTNYKERIICFGADPQGVSVSKTFNDKGFDYFNTPKIDYITRGIEDAFSYCSWFGLDALKELLKQKNLL
jgi:Crassvirales DNA primase